MVPLLSPTSLPLACILILLLSGIFRPVYNRLPARALSHLICLPITLIVMVPLNISISALSAEALHLYW